MDVVPAPDDPCHIAFDELRALCGAGPELRGDVKYVWSTDRAIVEASSNPCRLCLDLDVAARAPAKRLGRPPLELGPITDVEIIPPGSRR